MVSLSLVLYLLSACLSDDIYYNIIKTEKTVDFGLSLNFFHYIFIGYSYTFITCPHNGFSHKILHENVCKSDDSICLGHAYNIREDLKLFT